MSLSREKLFDSDVHPDDNYPAKEILDFALKAIAEWLRQPAIVTGDYHLEAQAVHSVQMQLARNLEALISDDN